MATPTTVIEMAKRLGNNARQVASKRYSLKDHSGRPMEDWDEIVGRVVTHVAQAETDYHERETFTRDLTEIIGERFFLPNTPCLVNAGRTNGQLAACFVLDVPDSIAEIMEHAKISSSMKGTKWEYLREGLRYFLPRIISKDFSNRR